MKLVLKDKTEITVTSVSDNYNAKGVPEDQARAVMISIMEPEDITVDYLAETLTIDNLSDVQMVTENGDVKTLAPCVVESIIGNLSDDDHYISIRASYVN